MKIIHLVLGKANPNNPNGVSRAVNNMALYQHRSQMLVEVWGITANPHGLTTAREYKLRLFPSLGSFIPSLSLVLSLFKSTRGAVFHLHGGICPQFFLVGLLLKFLGVPWVITPHGNYSDLFFPRKAILKKVYARSFESLLVSCANLVQANSPNEIGGYVYVRPDKIVYLPNGMSFDELAAEETVSPGSDEVIFGYCGRLDKEAKGLDILLRGFRQFKLGGGKGKLWIVGDGPDIEWMKRFVSENDLTDSVKFWGFVESSKEKVSLVKAMDVFVQVSRHEGMSSGLLEAAALGLPLIVSEGTNIGEQVRAFGAGIVLEKNDETSLAHALYNLADGGDLDQLGFAAKNMVETEFKWEKIVKAQFDLVYSRIIQ